MEFHEKLQHLRRRSGLTQEQLAERLFVSRTAVSKWESGRGYPNLESLKDISAHCGVSVSTVTQLFQKQADFTFHDFVTNRRMVMADRLIRDGIPLEQVGKMVGYQDHSTFYRAFRQHFGTSPREYRLQLENKEEE